MLQKHEIELDISLLRGLANSIRDGTLVLNKRFQQIGPGYCENYRRIMPDLIDRAADALKNAGMTAGVRIPVFDTIRASKNGPIRRTAPPNPEREEAAAE